MTLQGEIYFSGNPQMEDSHFKRAGCNSSEHEDRYRKNLMYKINGNKITDK